MNSASATPALDWHNWSEHLCAPETLLPRPTLTLLDINLASKKHQETFTEALRHRAQPSATWVVSERGLDALIKTQADPLMRTGPEWTAICQALKEAHERQELIANKADDQPTALFTHCQGAPLAFWCPSPHFSWRTIVQAHDEPAKIDDADWHTAEYHHPVFHLHEHLRANINLLVQTKPHTINLVFIAQPHEQDDLGDINPLTFLGMQALMVALAHTAQCPQWQSPPPSVCATINVWWIKAQATASGADADADADSDTINAVIKKAFSDTVSLVAAQTMARALTMLPPNVLTPKSYRDFVRQLAIKHGYGYKEWDEAQLRKMGAGAFLAVAQGAGIGEGSEGGKSAVVRLTKVDGAASSKFFPTPIFLGKGICFDTGGHQIKSAKSMRGMHGDMNGSAVALAIFHALAQNGMSGHHAYLAIADNALGPMAYRPGEVVRAINGRSIEVVHTDAEGRMVLADALALIAQEWARQADPKNAIVIDFATLTGSMTYALGARMSGFFTNRLIAKNLALRAAYTSGERLLSFPLAHDYCKGLDSKLADTLQCRMEGEADHILGALFLEKFVGDLAWIHVDLSASECAEGLGAVAGDINGFGVAWGVHLCQALKK